MGRVRPPADGGCDGPRQVFLQGKQVFEVGVKPLGPELISASGFDQLYVDSHPLAGLAHAPFDDVVARQLVGDRILALPGKSGGAVAGDRCAFGTRTCLLSSVSVVEVVIVNFRSVRVFV